MMNDTNANRRRNLGFFFDDTVRRIQSRDFAVISPPEAGICKECDIRMLCVADGVIRGAA